jgi:hypothetical protein
MIGNNLRIYTPTVFGSVLASLFTLFTLSVNVSAQDAPDYLFGNLTFEKNLTKEQLQEIIDKGRNYTSTMLKAANGNETKLNVLLIEDLAKRNIINEEAKQGFLSFIANMPKPPMGSLPGTGPGNLTLPGNVTLPGNSIDFLKDLDANSVLLDEIAKNNSDSQTVTLMTDILKKKVTDIGIFVSGNGTDMGLPPVTISSFVTPGQFGKAVLCASLTTLGGISGAGVAVCDLLA